LLPGETSPITTCVESESLIVDESVSVGTGVWTKISGTGNIRTGEESVGIGTVENLAINAIGVYRWVVSNGACVDRDSIDVTINRLSAISAATITLTDNETLNETYADLGATANLCESTSYTIRGSSINPLDEVGTWEIVSGTNVVITEDGMANQNFTPTGSGTTVLRWSIEKTGSLAAICPADAQEVSLVVFGELTADITTPAATESICDNMEELTLMTVGDVDNTTTAWREGTTNIDNLVTTTGDTHVIRGEDLGEGPYVLTWAVSNAGCGEETAEYMIEVDPVETPSVSLSNLDPICEGESLSIIAAPMSEGTTPTYEWSIDGIDQLETGNILTIPSASRDLQGIVEVRLMSSLECLTNEDPLAIGWYEGVPPTRRLIEGESGTVLSDVEEGGIYSFSETNGSCEETFTSTVTLTVLERPEIITLNPEQSQLEREGGGSVILFASHTGISGAWNIVREDEDEDMKMKIHCHY